MPLSTIGKKKTIGPIQARLGEAMKIYRSDNAIYIRDGESCGIFRVFPGLKGEAEVEIAVYRSGHLPEASAAIVSGGRLPREFRAPNPAIFKALLIEGLAAFRDRYRLWCDPSDARRAACYRHLLDRAGIPYRVFAGDAIEIL